MRSAGAEAADMVFKSFSILENYILGFFSLYFTSKYSFININCQAEEQGKKMKDKLKEFHNLWMGCIQLCLKVSVAKVVWRSWILRLDNFFSDKDFWPCKFILVEFARKILVICLIVIHNQDISVFQVSLARFCISQLTLTCASKSLSLSRSFSITWSRKPFVWCNMFYFIVYSTPGCAGL